MNVSRFSSFVKVIMLTVSFVLSSFIQKSDTKIYWNKERQLTWNDFLGKPPANGSNSAISNTTIIYSPSSQLKNGKLEVDIISCFDKTKSWVKVNAKDDTGLKHEQGHFDITEIYARKFRKFFIDSKFKEKGLNDKLRKKYIVNVNELNKYQDFYDMETDHHRNEHKQMEWNEKIAKELKRLEAYSEPHLSIKVN